jgi:hypothetical protein
MLKVIEEYGEHCSKKQNAREISPLFQNKDKKLVKTKVYNGK